ncbi:hypothetical protein SAOR_00420 [Salinisphaera orenii MK-B5]|uniref:Pilus assembly protein PilW n=1 Tax=Salinisphaera orenii MK-B5 TaxID=856730 RepID=A0A423PYA8_9GAMM|nr:prepilin-type N-terminal cleavage/methylation domain-containing protein [Salinisphaera orenii]ROO30575.1 hypothetical protein SAOR_00420 [Salinisphaera orenii MK-B5]
MNFADKQRRVQGLALVELMIALLIGSLLLLGVVGLFAASRQTQDAQAHLNRVAEDIRFLTDFMARDIRMAGYQSDDCGALSAALAWDAAERILTARYCEGATAFESVYDFEPDSESGDPTVRYVEREIGTSQSPEGLLEGVVLNRIWFGVETGDGNLRYVSSGITDAEAVRTVRLNLTFRGAVAVGVTPSDRALPSIEFTVAVRNNTLTPLTHTESGL